MATKVDALVSVRASSPAETHTYPALTTLLLGLSDQIALSMAILASAALRHHFEGQFDLRIYLDLWPVLALFTIVYFLCGLYPGVVFNWVTEIKQVAAATTVVYLILAALIYMFRVPEAYSRLVFLMAWAMSLGFVPLMRNLLRTQFGGRNWWGYRVLVLTGGKAGAKLLRKLDQQPELGFRVAAVLHDEADSHGSGLCVPEWWGWEKAAILASHHNISRAILLLPQAPAKQMLKLLHTYAKPFSHLYIVPDLEGLSSLGIQAHDLSHVLALEVRNKLLLPSSRLIKRVIDLLLGGAIAVVTLPLILLITALIKLDSRGPAFYGQVRIGLRGNHFKLWKFRSMALDADRILNSTLERNPELKREWARDHKLRNDPRITRVGRFLRKTSLDELPQLWNVFKGDMSLVGPRPIVEAEIVKYGERFGLYMEVLPGITGLWQVSGRNDTTYGQRVDLDTYYVRNWSPWLDIYALAKTVTVVLACRGAY
jgi:Undecaprenyl-phosphate galactose phosphotransferase WbaP